MTRRIILLLTAIATCGVIFSTLPAPSCSQHYRSLQSGVKLETLVGKCAEQETDSSEHQSNKILTINDDDEEDSKWNATIWAVLVAGSNEYYNYRHQADICHAFHVLKDHGIPESNIIVMMYDDIAHNEDNPTPGVILNQLNGTNVYSGVPKDYTNREVSIV